MSECNQGPCEKGVVIQYQSNGDVTEINGGEGVKPIVAYISTAVAVAADGDATPSARPVVVMMSDIFGYELPNNRMVADLLSANGITCILADFFDGTAWNGPVTDREKFMVWRNAIDNNRVEQILRVCVEYARGSLHAPRVGVVGFCWGGTKVVEATLLTHQDISLVDASVAFYASQVNAIFPRLETETPLCPLLGLFGATDANIPPAVVLELKRLISRSKHETDAILFDDVGHGFAHRADETPQALDARQRMLDFFNKYLLV
jgi:carboxymethylenebutenolidase